MVRQGHGWWFAYRVLAYADGRSSEKRRPTFQAAYLLLVTSKPKTNTTFSVAATPLPEAQLPWPTMLHPVHDTPSPA